MPRPRANWTCRTCAKTKGEGFRIEAPLDAKRCPYCGHARGFRRLFDAVQTSTTGHRVARFIDKRLGPQSDKHRATQDGAKRFERDLSQAHAKAYELAQPEERKVLAQTPPLTGTGGMQAAAAFSSIDPAARRDSYNHTWPMVKRQVRPEWQR